MKKKAPQLLILFIEKTMNQIPNQLKSYLTKISRTHKNRIKMRQWYFFSKAWVSRCSRSIFSQSKDKEAFWRFKITISLMKTVISLSKKLIDYVFKPENFPKTTLIFILAVFTQIWSQSLELPKKAKSCRFHYWL
jgi:hypothetical protein